MTNIAATIIFLQQFIQHRRLSPSVWHNGSSYFTCLHTAITNWLFNYRVVTLIHTLKRYDCVQWL